MKYDLEKNNNSKKIIIGISILFCAVILIVGGTFAFFTQSNTKEIGNIVTTDIDGTIGYIDNNNYMLGNLIPINVSDINKAYTREDNLKCRDDSGYNVCSIYNFTITNNANVTQSLIIDLYPVVNSFYNLRFNLYDITNNKLLISNKELKYDDKTNITLDNIILNNTNNKSNTYELVFYIENQNYAQDDAGKSFGATIKVNSITTGYNIVKDLGTGCWKADENDSTTLSEFTGYTDKNENGYFDETDELKKECEMYFKKDTDNYYIVNVPSTYGGYTFKSLGNSLFSVIEEYSYNEETGEEIVKFNEYIKIKNITITEGIEEIEDVYEDENFTMGFTSTFFGVGRALENQELNMFLPSSMTKIGIGAFSGSAFSSINIPDNVHTIGKGAFSNTKLTSIIIPINVKTIEYAAFRDNELLEKVIFETDENGESSLVSIGEYAFSGCNLNYQDRIEPLIIPNSIGEIGAYAFSSEMLGDANPNLHYIKYTGNNQDILNNTNGWYEKHYIKELITAEE